MATVTQMRGRAKELGLKGYSRMSREQLESALSQVEPDGRKPKAPQAAAWTPEKREKMRQKMKEYYETHDGPLLGKNLSEETKEKIREAALEREVVAHCIVCGRGLSPGPSAEKGIGPLCEAKMAQEEE